MSGLPDDLRHVANDLVAAGLAPRPPQVFLHSTRRTRKFVAYDVEKLRAAAALVKPRELSVDKWRELVLDSRRGDIDIAYAMSIPESRAMIPAVVGYIRDPGEPEPYPWYMDGNHRLYRAHRLGIPTFPMAVLSFEATEACRYPDEVAGAMHRQDAESGETRDIMARRGP